jgi:cytochrome bd-type quinol oxidase subunit 2
MEKVNYANNFHPFKKVPHARARFSRCSLAPFLSAQHRSMHLLLNVPFVLQLLLVVGLAVALSLSGLDKFRKRVDHHKRAALNEVAGVNFAVFGGLFGVVLAFVLVGTWERFQDARSVTEREANSAADLGRLALAVGLPAISHDCRDYLETVSKVEWKMMDHFAFSAHAQLALDDIQRAVFAFQPSNDREQSLFDAMLIELSQIADARRERLARIPDSMPIVMWLFLIPVGCIVIVYSYLFGLEDRRAHMFMTGALALTVAYSLLIIFNLQFPFSGALKVHPDAFRKALAEPGWLPASRQDSTPQ